MPLWMVMVLLAAAFAALFGVEAVDLDYDRLVKGHKVVLTLETESGPFEFQGEFGAVFQDDGRVRPQLGLSLKPKPQVPSPFRLETLPQLRFEIFSLEGLQVRVGQFVNVGDRVAVRDPEEYERILRALEQAASDGDEKLIEELQRRKEAQEVRSLLAGEVVHIGLFQDGPKLSVVVYLSPVLPPGAQNPNPKDKEEGKGP